jgi:hypothetical protein
MNLILDSGAFSAFTMKKSIDLDKYCEFILQNREYITKSINLDVIDPQGPDVAAEAGMKNFLHMLDKDIHSMPVFHAREKIMYLDRYLDLADYVGLSGTSLVSPVEDRSWHRLMWNYLTDNDGYPISKFHSFGNTSPYTMLTMPFYSADSATWMIQAGRAARIKLQGKSYQLRSNTIGDTNFISIDDRGPKRESWRMEIRELGLNPDKVMSVEAKGSMMAMIRSYLVASDLLKLIEQTRYSNKFLRPNSLFMNKKKHEGGIQREGPVNCYFVISPSAFFMNAPVIAALGIQNLLVSYYYVVTAHKDFWHGMLIPFLNDPIGFCLSHPKLKRGFDKLQEVLLEPTQQVTV